MVILKIWGYGGLSLNMRNLTINEKVKLINGTNVNYDLFTHAPITAFTLININYVDLNDL
jgi:hypothetical protein